MITVITSFQLPNPITKEQARNIFLSTAPKYQGVPGLFRKCYILSEDGKTAGGVYLGNLELKQRRCTPRAGKLLCEKNTVQNLQSHTSTALLWLTTLRTKLLLMSSLYFYAQLLAIATKTSTSSLNTDGATRHRLARRYAA